jgi:hypothetical protein
MGNLFMPSSSTYKRCILYYPTISIPHGRWLKQVILYWDEIGSIVPQNYEDQNLIPYTPAVQHLKDEGLFRPIKPENLIYQDWQKLENFEQEFRSILESEEFKKWRARRIPIPKSLVSNDTVPTLSRIHEDKVSNSLMHYLEEKGLAQREPNSEWYFFENNTALLYMGLLAKYLADIDINLTIPGTNFEIYEELIFSALSKSEGFACLRTNLVNTLPVPREDVPLKKIVEFKRKRQAELLRFQSEIEAYEKEIRKCQAKTRYQRGLHFF